MYKPPLQKVNKLALKTIFMKKYLFNPQIEIIKIHFSLLF